MIYSKSIEIVCTKTSKGVFKYLFTFFIELYNAMLKARDAKLQIYILNRKFSQFYRKAILLQILELISFSINYYLIETVYLIYYKSNLKYKTSIHLRLSTLKLKATMKDKVKLILAI